MNRPGALKAVPALLLLSSVVFAANPPAIDSSLASYLQNAGYRVQQDDSILRLGDGAVAPHSLLVSKADLDLDGQGRFVEAKSRKPAPRESLPKRFAELFSRDSSSNDRGRSPRRSAAPALAAFRASLSGLTAQAPTRADPIALDELWDRAPKPASSTQVQTNPANSSPAVRDPRRLPPFAIRRHADQGARPVQNETPGPSSSQSDRLSQAPFETPTRAVPLTVERVDARALKVAASKNWALRLTAITARSFRIQALVAGERVLNVPEFMVVTPDESRAPVPLEVITDPDGRSATLRTAEAELEVRSPDGSIVEISVSTLAPRKKIIEHWTLNPETQLSRLSLEKDEHIYGFGDKRAALDQRGHEIEIANHDAYASSDNDSYKSIPFYISSGGYGLFFHNFFRSHFDIGASDPSQLSLQATGGQLDFYVFLGDPKSVVSQYTELTGRPALLPLWFFGYHQGKASYAGREGLDVARRMRQEKLPVDTIYYDDWVPEAVRKDFIDALWKKHQIRLTLGANPFVIQAEDPELLKEMASRGFLMADASGKPLIEPADEISDDGPLAAGYIDFFNPKAVEFYVRRKWSQALRRGAYIGMADFGELDHIHDGDKKFWPALKDLTVEQSRDLFGLVYPAMLFEAVQNVVGGRPTGMVRPGFAGSQRLGWTTTADSTPDFAQMRVHLRALLNLTLTGYSNVGFDIGGWEKKGPNDVYIRWFAAGAFNPFMWAHGQGEHEPYSHGPEVEKAARTFLELRYRLIPYFYSLGEAAHRTGIPIQRTLAMQEPDDERSSAVDDEFFVGDHLLIAPVMDPKGRKVYLPKGTWFDFFGEKPTVQGPAEIDRPDVPFDRIPAYARSGAVIPLGPVMQRTGEKAVDPLTVHFFAYPKTELLAGDKSSEFNLYEDDGRSNDYEKGRFQRTVLRFTQGASRIRFSAGIVSGDGRYQAVPGRRYVVVLHGVKVRCAFVNGKAVKLKSDSRNSETVVSVPSSKSSLEVELE